MKRATILASALLLAAMPAAQAAVDVTEIPQWPDEAKELFASLPIQDQGRVKPMDTFAQFSLLQLNGKRTMRIENESGKAKLDHIDWLMTLMFHPEIGRQLPVFRIDDSAAIVAVGLDPHEEKRGWYSFEEVTPARRQIFEMAMSASEKDAKLRDPIEQQVLSLAHGMRLHENIQHFMDFAEARFDAPDGTVIGELLPEDATLSQVLEAAPATILALREKSQSMDAATLEREVNALSGLMERVHRYTQGSMGISIFPPANPETKEWLDLNELTSAALDVPEPGEPPVVDNPAVDMVALLEQTWQERGDSAAFTGALAALHEEVKHLAALRGEYEKIPLELLYYNGQFLWWSLYLFILSFVIVAISWLFPKSALLRVISPISVAVPTVLLIIGITLRCIIRERPPVTTLYETLLFITAVVVLTCLLLEWMNRQRIGVSLGAFLGMLGMFLAFRYEAKEATDTMPQLVAVLDTNFWLATHVVIVTMGYAAGLLAAGLAHLYIFGRFFKIAEKNKKVYKDLTRMTYGVVCFGLLFAVVGTILGGIWANDSWGRFWGWDPKENGALLICLWGLVMLHARMGGYIRDAGLAIMSIILGMVVVFSWWGVNLLGVGLHSYGFTSGIMFWLMVYWIAQTAVAGVGVVVALRDKVEREAKREQEKAAKEKDRRDQKTLTEETA